ncbi:50S ribosomal protein L2 [bacterium]|nr:50S ribosomal protein L2 [bacterium]MCB1220261.1 50S ribosomal protein L2 [bacterium]UNM07937.1 MAG: 50S ribosomal protein L2 [Planctomycetales bacterium]
MPIKKYKPYTPSRRGMSVIDYSATLTGDKPEKSLLERKKKHSGRNNTGRVTVRSRGGGNRQHYRLVDFKRVNDAEAASVQSIQYDPNRTAFIALVRYESGKLSYVICPEGVKVGDRIQSGPESSIKVGNTLPLENIPDGTVIHNIEIRPGQKGKLVRAAGTSAQVMAKEGSDAIIRLPSGEMRRVNRKCRATIGTVSNSDNSNVKLGNAGRNRHRGRRPHVRGTVMNPVDHPHGGGEGRTNSGRPPTSATGVLAKGYRTRSKSKSKRHLVKDRRVK